MFNVTGGELLLILMLALIVLGPERLPDAARKIGRAVGQLRDLSGSFQREIRDAFEETTGPIVKPGSRPQLTAIEGGGSRDASTPLAAAPVDGGESRAVAESAGEHAAADAAGAPTPPTSPTSPAGPPPAAEAGDDAPSPSGDQPSASAPVEVEADLAEPPTATPPPAGADEGPGRGGTRAERSA